MRGLPGSQPLLGSQPLAARLFWLPIVAGCTWFVTLATLLIYWLAKGRPEYPWQLNPDVAFISDIGASRPHGFFIAGGTITAVSFAGTIVSVHSVRYHRRMYAVEDVKWRKVLSIAASIFGVAAGASLILLTIFDTAFHHDTHQKFLLCTFGALALCSIATTVVWFDQTWKPSDFEGLRSWCLASNAFVALEVFLVVSFILFALAGNFLLAGIFEWILTFAGCGYLFCFVGYLWVPRDVLDIEDGRQPLLATGPSSYTLEEPD